MYRIPIFLTLFCALLLCASCSVQTNNSSSYVGTEKTAQQLLALHEIPYETDWLEKLKNQNLSIADKVEGYATANPEMRSVYILCDYTKYGTEKIYHDAYLAVETDTKILFQSLATDNYPGSYGDNLYVCDIDGDGIDEILIQQPVGLTGGAGQYLSRIFKVVGDEIQEIFQSSTGNLFDTGFTGFLKDNLELVVGNRFTQYETTFDLSANQQNFESAFNEMDGTLECETILCDSFREFAPEDVDYDGVCEIVCLQYVSLYGHADYIGDAKSVLKFNSQTQNFEVVQAEFIPAT